MVSRLSDSLRRRPVAFAFASATTKTFTADVLVQATLEGKCRPEDLDWRRTAAFTIFGGGWMGLGQYGLYCQVFERMLPARTSTHALGKMALDQFLHVPFLYFPIFYTVGTAQSLLPLSARPSTKTILVTEPWLCSFRRMGARSMGTRPST